MSILAPKVNAAFQYYRHYRARRKAARILAGLDEHVLDDIGFGRRPPQIEIE
jgi:uncharacterized protein YjiS (DUF1127 family)